MNKWIIGIVAVVVIAFGGTWCFFFLRLKTRYERVCDELGKDYEVKVIDGEFCSFLTDVEKTWSNKVDMIAGPHSEAVKLAGFTPSASNLMHLMSSPLPTWSMFSPHQNRKSVVLALVKCTLRPVAIDHAIHVSPDRHMAAIWCRTNVVYIFQDKPTGMREALYFKYSPKRKAASKTQDDTDLKPDMP